MTRKDYALIASVIVYTKSQGLTALDHESVDTVARFMSITLALNSDTFNSSKFLQACGIEA